MQSQAITHPRHLASPAKTLTYMLQSLQTAGRLQSGGSIEVKLLKSALEFPANNRHSRQRASESISSERGEDFASQ